MEYRKALRTSYGKKDEKGPGEHNRRSQEGEEQGCPCLAQKCLEHHGYSRELTGLGLEGRSYTVGFRRRRENR